MLTITPIAYNISTFDLFIDHNQATWRGLEGGFQDYEIFFFDGTKTIQISNNQTDQDLAPKVSNGQVAWYTLNDSDTEILFYDGKQTIQLTDNGANDAFPEISNGQVLWYQYIALPVTENPYDAESQAEIFLYNGTNTVRVTDNQVDDRNAKFYGNQVV